MHIYCHIDYVSDVRDFVVTFRRCFKFVPVAESERCNSQSSFIMCILHTKQQRLPTAIPVTSWAAAKYIYIYLYILIEAVSCYDAQQLVFVCSFDGQAVEK